MGWASPNPSPTLGRAWAKKSGLINTLVGLGLSGRKSEALPKYILPLIECRFA